MASSSLGKFLYKFNKVCSLIGNGNGKSLLLSPSGWKTSRRCMSNLPNLPPELVFDDDKDTPLKKEKVSKAMRAYLERARQHDEFMKRQLDEYNIGKRHLANMMGENAETFEQKDIDQAIQYLFPSGLYDARARPMMKPPEEVFPQRKEAEFDASGRPHHFLFYTGKPNFFKLLYDITDHIQQLNEFEDKMIKKHLTPDASKKIEMSGSEWLPKEDMEKFLVETLIVKEYKDFVATMERLADHPYSYRLKDFIDKFRKPLMSQTKTYDIPKPMYDAEGRSYVTTQECLRKTARGEVTVRSPGTGLIRINGRGIDYFENDQPREQLKEANVGRIPY